MNWFQFDKKIHMKRLHVLRRGLASALTLAMLLPILPLGSHAAAAVAPVKAVTNVDSAGNPDGSGEKPTLTIEVNGVIDQANHLTGFVEVAIRVKPGLLHLDANNKPVNSATDPSYDHSEIQPFASMAVALEYSEKLTPWEWEKTNGNWVKLDAAESPAQAVALTDSLGMGFSSEGMTEVDALHRKARIAHAAVSAKTDDEGNADGVDFNDGGYLYLMAGGFDSKSFQVGTDPATGLPMAEDTVLAVVRFQYTLDETDQNKNPWSTMFPKGRNNPNVTDWIDPNSTGWLVRLADEAIVDDADDPIIDWELTYDSGKSAARPNGNGFYYSTDISDGREAYDPSLPTTDPNYCSTYSNCMDVALVNTSAATPSTTDVVPGVVNYTLVNRLSYDSALQGNGAVILYYDYTNQLIGVQDVIPGDARQAVNDFVEENFIHPDLRYSDHQGSANEDDYTSSLLRKDTYRGEYPYDAPEAIPDVTSATYEADKAAYEAAIAGRTAADGADYPLTNKLDYVFYKRYTEMGQSVISDPDGVPDSGDEIYGDSKTVISDPDGVPDSGDETYHIDQYEGKILGGLTAADVADPDVLEMPYIYGWAVVEDVNDIANVWTTLGTAELTAYEGMDTTAGNVPKDAAIDTTLNSTGDCLQFADFSEMEKGQVLYVKAVYEPGPELRNDEMYSAMTPPAYERYGDADTEMGGVYSISFTYARINMDGRGVNRVRDAAVRIDYTPDVEGEGQKSFSIGIDLDNYDTLPVTYTPSSALMSMEYSVRDKLVYIVGRLADPVMVEYNFYTGSERSSHSNLTNIMDNFNYTEHPYSQHLGSMGFVTVATMNQIAKLCREAVATGVMTDLNAYVTFPTITDMNWKADMNETEFAEWELPSVIAKLLDAYRIAGDEELDWHQVQYHLINSTYDWGTETVTGGLTNPGGTGVVPAAGGLAYNWCRIDTCSGGSSPINDWTDLMAAAADHVYTPNTNALNQLQDVFGLRQDHTATPFADKDAMKTKLVSVVTDLKANGVTQAEVESLTWTQVQYLMDVGTTGVVSGAIPSDSDIMGAGSTYEKDYWWKDNGKKTISTWQELLEIRYHINNDSYFAGDNSTTGWMSEYTLNDKLTGNVRDKDSGGNWLAPGSSYATMDVALRKDDAGKLFDTEAQFLAALDTALGLLDPSYPNGSFSNISLMEIQHALLGKPYATEPDLMGDGPSPVSPAVSYWWITGVKAPTTLQELVELVDQVNGGSPEDLLDVITTETMSKAPFWLRADTDGKAFADDASLRSALKTQVAAWKAALGGSFTGVTDWPNAGPKNDPSCNWSDPGVRQTWSQFQNLLLGNAWDPDPDDGTNGYKFWWYGDGQKPITTLEELLEAAWNSYGNPTVPGTPPDGSVDPNAMDALTAADLEFIAGLELATNPGIDPADYLYLRADKDGNAFTDIDTFKQKLQAAIAKVAPASGEAGVKALTWIELQHILYDGTYYTDETTLRGNPTINYWWENGGSKPTSGFDVDTLVYQISEVVTDVEMGGGAHNPTEEQELLEKYLAQLKLKKATGEYFSYSAADIAEFKGILTNMANDAIFHTYSADFNPSGDWATCYFTWNEIQYYIDTGTLMNEANEGIPVTYPHKPTDAVNIKNAMYELTEKVSDVDNGGGVHTPTEADEALAEYMGVIKMKKSDGSDYYSCSAADIADFRSVINTMVGDAIFHTYSADFNPSGDWATCYFTWKEVQYYIMNGVLFNEANEGIPDNYDWMPDSAASTSMASFSLRPQRAPGKAPQPVRETETSPDGLTETTKVVKKVYNGKTGGYDTVTTVTAVTRTQTGGVTVVTTTVTTTVVSVDPETGEATVETSSNTATTIETEEVPVETPKPAESTEDEKKDNETYSVDGDTSIRDVADGELAETPDTTDDPADETDDVIQDDPTGETDNTADETDDVIQDDTTDKTDDGTPNDPIGTDVPIGPADTPEGTDDGSGEMANGSELAESEPMAEESGPPKAAPTEEAMVKVLSSRTLLSDQEATAEESGGSGLRLKTTIADSVIRLAGERKTERPKLTAALVEAAVRDGPPEKAGANTVFMEAEKEEVRSLISGGNRAGERRAFLWFADYGGEKQAPRLGREGRTLSGSSLSREGPPPDRKALWTTQQTQHRITLITGRTTR